MICGPELGAGRLKQEAGVTDSRLVVGAETLEQSEQKTNMKLKHFNTHMSSEQSPRRQLDGELEFNVHFKHRVHLSLLALLHSLT